MLHRFTGDLRFFWFFSLLATLAEITTQYLIAIGQTNLWVFNAFFALEYGIFIYLLSVWQEQRSRQLYRLSIPVVLAVYGATFLLMEDYGTFNVPGKFIITILLLAAVLHSLSQLLSAGDSILHRNYKFWILFGMLIYFGATVFVFLAGQMYVAGVIPESIWIIHNISNILANTFYGVGFLWAAKAA